MIEPSTLLVPRMSMLPATTTPLSVLGAALGLVNEPISMLVFGQTMVAVSSAWLSNSVEPVNSQELEKWVYAVAAGPASGPLNVQFWKRMLFPFCEPFVIIWLVPGVPEAISTLVFAKLPLPVTFVFDQVMPSSLFVVGVLPDTMMSCS